MAKKPLSEILNGETRFGRLSVVGEDHHRSVGVNRNQRYAACVCDCGAGHVANAYALRRGIIRSCGCLRDDVVRQRSVTHGQAGPNRRTPEYRAWADAKTRCYNPNVRNYAQYGGRGIRMCDRWRNSFEAFFEDMGPRPSSGHSLDRWPDGDGHYEPGNVRWATSRQQGRNVSTNRLIEYGGEKFTLVEASERFGLKRATIAKRLNDGWSVEDALTVPIRLNSRWHIKP